MFALKVRAWINRKIKQAQVYTDCSGDAKALFQQDF
jgi:hypothetical protein